MHINIKEIFLSYIVFNILIIRALNGVDFKLIKILDKIKFVDLNHFISPENHSMKFFIYFKGFFVNFILYKNVNNLTKMNKITYTNKQYDTLRIGN